MFLQGNLPMEKKGLALEFYFFFKKEDSKNRFFLK